MSINFEKAKMYEMEIQGKSFQYFDLNGGFDIKDLRNQNTVAFNSTNRPNLRYPFYVNVNDVDENGFMKPKVNSFEGSTEVWATTVEGRESVWRWGREKAERQSDDLVARQSNDGLIRVYVKRRTSTTMPKSFWNETNFLSITGTRELDKLFNKKIFTFPKPEGYLKRIIDIASEPGDLVLDFFMGSATTQAVAMKMHRRFIGIEQMDYTNTVSIPRLQKVMDGEQGGISKDVNWQGGGSFIYVELMPKNMGYLQDIIQAKDLNELKAVYTRMLTGTDTNDPADISFRADLDKIDWSQGFEDNKRLLVKLLDKNGLYYNYSEIDDENVRHLLSDEDYYCNKSFYEGEG